MTRYLLDTDTLIDFAKGWEPTRSRVLQLIETADELAICAINVAEFVTGLPDDQGAVWEDFLGSLAFWEITRDVALLAGRVRAELARGGKLPQLGHSPLHPGHRPTDLCRVTTPRFSRSSRRRSSRDWNVARIIRFVAVT